MMYDAALSAVSKLVVMPACIVITVNQPGIMRPETSLP
jgi:hypothetical protein